MIIELISVGTEILLGDIVNTNAQYIAEFCARLGFDLFHQSVVGDNPARLRDAIDLAVQRSDIVILTGGLGSTGDDITKTVSMEYIGKESMEDAESKDRILDYFQEERARQENQRVYTFPKDSIVLENHVGTASGAWMPFERYGEKKVLVIMPGPPNEMIPMLEESLAPILHGLNQEITASLPVKIGILGEYKANEILEEEINHAKNPTFAPYVKSDGAMIRITAKGRSQAEVDGLLEEAYQRLEGKLGKYIVARGKETRSEALVRLLKERSETIACAESITGGMIASTIIDAAGASEVIGPSFIVYSDQAKANLLEIDTKLIEEKTAVSAEVCQAMLEGLAKKTGADLCLVTTGYAGPGGEKVGRVFIGLSYQGKSKISPYQLHGDREMIRRRARNLAIDSAILALKGQVE